MIHEIAGVKYLLFDYATNSNREIKELTRWCIEKKCILQGTNITQGGLFSSAIGHLKVLVPENLAMEFSNKYINS